MNILKAVNLRKIYGQGETEVRALDGINLEVEKGEFVAIVGTSGSGKSTLLHIIGGLDNPTSGQVIVDGQNLSHMPDEELTIFRRRNIGFVFQQYNLVPMLNVWENIVLPVKLDGKKIEKGYVNEIIDTLPQVIPTAHVVSSAGCPAAGDNLHFTARWIPHVRVHVNAETMLQLLGYRALVNKPGSNSG